MSRVTVCSLSLAAVFLASSPVFASQSPATTLLTVSPDVGCEGLPASLVVDPRLRAVILDMRRRAPTFRRQILRLVEHPGLVVAVGVWQFHKADGVGARTRIRLERGRLRAADVEIRLDVAPRVVEFIAHEFEHILEQLDGIDLTRWIGRGGVRRVGGAGGDQPIETERARRMGRIIAGEYDAAGSAMPACGARS